MKTSIVVPICGTYSHWKVASPDDPPELINEREVTLRIEGNSRDGYHLVMAPAGCFVADSWHATIEDAIDTAFRVFGVSPNAWHDR